MEVTEDGRTISRANTGFSIAEDKRLDAKIATDKISYNPNETIAITSVVNSRSANYIFENLTAKLTISSNSLNGLNGPVFVETKTISALMPEATFTFKSYCPAATNQAGTYTARLEVLSGQTVLAVSSAGFEVLSTSRTGTGIAGTITAIPDTVYQGREEVFGVTVTNNGTGDVAGLTVSVIIADPDTGEARAEVRSEESGVRRGETITSTQTITTANLAPKKYLAILQAATPEMTAPKTLASATFAVKPGIEVSKKIPDVTNLLVWVNTGMQNAECGMRSDSDEEPHAFSHEFTRIFTHDYQKTKEKGQKAEDREQTKESGVRESEGKDGDKDDGDDDDKDDNKDHGKQCLRIDLLEDALGQAATSYHIVYDKKDFQTELRNPLYTDFMVLGERHHLEDHFDEELREQVNAGKGLILSQYHHERLERDLFGIKIDGSLPDKCGMENRIIELVGNELGIQGSFPASGNVVKVKDADPATVIGSITVAEKNRSIRYPAVVKRQYGNGKALFFAFDLGASAADAVVFPALLKHSLEYIHTARDASAVLPNQLVPVEIEVKSLRAAFDLRITEAHPDSLRIAECGVRNAELNSSKDTTCAWITDNPRVMDIRLEAGETKKILYYALMPDAEDTYILSTQVGYLENGAYTPYQDLNAEITAVEDSAALAAGLLSALDALPATSRDRERLRDAKKHVLKALERTVLSARDIEKTIHDLLKASDALIQVTSADITEIRLMLDRLLEFHQAEWYHAFPRQTQ
jgi:hypothetical protein